MDRKDADRPQPDFDERARAFATKLIALAEIVPAREGVDMVNVRTIEVCRAMGRPEGAKLEEVQKFVYKVLEFLRDRDLYTACGCGYLSLMIAPVALRDKAFEESRDLSSYTPEDIESYLEGARRGG